MKPLGNRHTPADNKKGMKNRLFTGAGLALASLWLAGCAGMGTPKTPEEAVTQRAQARMDALVAGNFEKARSYTSPSFRQRESVNDYTRRYAGSASWTGATVSQVTCQEARCDVRIQLDYLLHRSGMESTRSLDERWINVDGTWYVYHR